VHAATSRLPSVVGELVVHKIGSLLTCRLLLGPCASTMHLPSSQPRMLRPFAEQDMLRTDPSMLDTELISISWSKLCKFTHDILDICMFTHSAPQRAHRTRLHRISPFLCLLCNSNS
jgi:hypothetical protein